MGNDGPLTTVSGGYYTGMALPQAKNKEKFKEIDRNGNNKLEEDEIIYKRQEEVKHLRELATGATVTAAGVIAGCAIAAPETFGTSFLPAIPAAILGVGGSILATYADSQETLTNHAIYHYNKSHPNSVFKK